jgi:hypothetical protein
MKRSIFDKLKLIDAIKPYTVSTWSEEQAGEVVLAKDLYMTNFNNRNKKP